MKDQCANPAAANSRPIEPTISTENPLKSQGSYSIPVAWSDASAFVAGLLPADVFLVTHRDRWSISLIRRAPVTAQEQHVELRFLPRPADWTTVEIDSTSFRMLTGLDDGEAEDTVRAIFAAISPEVES